MGGNLPRITARTCQSQDEPRICRILGSRGDEDCASTISVPAPQCAHHPVSHAQHHAPRASPMMLVVFSSSLFRLGQ